MEIGGKREGKWSEGKVWSEKVVYVEPTWALGTH
jgi:hypothetical protein